MANPKPARWRPPGTSTSSSIRFATARFCPSSISNGYKINNPTLLARISHLELEQLFRGYGWTPYFVEGSDPDSMHQAMAATLEHANRRDPPGAEEARSTGVAERLRWPMIVMRTPKGWGAPLEVGGHRLEGSWRAHQVPCPMSKRTPTNWPCWNTGCAARNRRSCSMPPAKLRPELKELAPAGTRRMSANPHANGGILKRALRLPDFRSYGVALEQPGKSEAENTRPLGVFPARRDEGEHE